jgi:hypothetical protein
MRRHCEASATLRWAASCLLAALLPGVAPTAVAADLVFTAQARSVDVASTTIADLWELGTNPFFPDFDAPSLSPTADASDSDMAIDFTAFSATLNLTNPGIPLLTTVGEVSATQTSALEARAISAVGGFDASRDAHTIDAGALATISALLGVTYNFGIARDSQTGASSFQTTFDVTKEAVYRVTGTLTVSAVGGLFPGDTLSDASVELRPVAGAPLFTMSISQDDFCSAGCEPGAVSFDQPVTLPPGSYELTADAGGAATGTCADIGGGLTCATSPTYATFVVELVESTEVPALGTGAQILLALMLGACACGFALRLPARARAAVRGAH